MSAVVEPHMHDPTAIVTASAKDFAGREGFDADFLVLPVPLPGLVGAHTVVLPYTHFSVLLRPDKRLAAVIGVGIDGRAAELEDATLVALAGGAVPDRAARGALAVRGEGLGIGQQLGWLTRQLHRPAT